MSFLLAEQNTMVALRYANYGYILENGRVVMDGEAARPGVERGREGVLPRALVRRPRSPSATSNTTAAASVGLPDHCLFVHPFLRPTTSTRWKRATRSYGSVRSSPELPRQIAHAKACAPAFAKILAQVSMRPR